MRMAAVSFIPRESAGAKMSLARFRSPIADESKAPPPRLASTPFNLKSEVELTHDRRSFRGARVCDPRSAGKVSAGHWRATDPGATLSLGSSGGTAAGYLLGEDPSCSHFLNPQNTQHKN